MWLMPPLNITTQKWLTLCFFDRKEIHAGLFIYLVSFVIVMIVKVAWHVLISSIFDFFFPALFLLA